MSTILCIVCSVEANNDQNQDETGTFEMPSMGAVIDSTVQIQDETELTLGKIFKQRSYLESFMR